MNTIYKGLWLLFLIAVFAVIDMRLPFHGFTWVQSSDWWQGAKMVVQYFLLPYLFLRAFEVAAVTRNYGQTNQPTNQVASQPTNQLKQPTISIEPTNQTTYLPPPGYGPEPGELSDAVKRSVYALAREGSTKAAAERLNLSTEAVRKNVLKAREVAPEWVATVLQE